MHIHEQNSSWPLVTKMPLRSTTFRKCGLACRCVKIDVIEHSVPLQSTPYFVTLYSVSDRSVSVVLD